MSTVSVSVIGSQIAVTVLRSVVTAGAPTEHNSLGSRDAVDAHPQAAITGLVADLALKAPLASPALTGTPTAPTAAADTSTTQIATTAFAKGEADAAQAASQPVDSDLTAIAALTTTSYGRGFLPLADAAAALAYVGAGADSLAMHLAGIETATGLKTFNAGLATTKARLIPGSGAPAYAEGNVYWDDSDHTLAVQTEIDGVTLQVGQEMHVRATNNTGVPILNGSAVYVSGAIGSRPTIALAIATSSLADKVIGICTFDIADNATGYITTNGVVHDLNTSAWVEGTELFISETVAGAFTSTRPVAPNHGVSVGIVLRQHATLGELLVHLDAGASLAALHDVLLTTLANKDAIRYNSTAVRWENTNKAGWLDTAASWTALQTFTAGVTVSAGTTSLQAVTCTTLTASGTINNRTFEAGSDSATVAIRSASTQTFLQYRTSAGVSLGYTGFGSVADLFVVLSAAGGSTASMALGATVLLGSERLRVAGGTMGTPGVTDVLVAAGKLYAGDTSATSIQTAGGIRLTASSVGATYWGATTTTTGATRTYGNGAGAQIFERYTGTAWLEIGRFA